MKPTLAWLSDPEVFQVNRERAHSDHKFYQSRKEMLQGESMLCQSLNGTWKFSYAENPSKRQADFYKEEVSCESFASIQVPGHIQLQGYDRCQYINTMYPWDGQEELRPPQVSETYNPVGSYVKYFEVEKELEGKRLYLSFQGVETAMYVWLNGEFLGYSEDSFTPSEFEVTDKIRQGENKLAVEVYKRSSASWLEDQDFWRFSGIFRDVFLYAVPRIHVRDIFVHAHLTDDYTKGLLNLEMELLEAAQGEMEAALYDREGNCIVKEEIPLAEKINAVFQPKEVHLWSAESPYLYTLELCIRNEAGEQVEWIRQKIGFRNFEMIDNVMCINGKRIMFHGVNRHEFNAKLGRAITKEDMLWDIRFMKQNNINAVRTSHYPNQSLWYELCDEYGIYLIDENNLESHGSWQKMGACEPSWNVPASLPQWKEAVLDRARSMVERDKNHPSIIIWSCGNECYAGENMLAISKYFHEKDPSRLVHYEGVFWNRDYHHTSDMESRMYAKPQEIEAYLQEPDAKPFLSCEYMHAMGNSCGGLEIYTALEDKYTGYQGGFIWDYIDQAIYQKGENKQERLVYGGYHDERATDYCFCTDGIIYADRTPSPKVQEVKQLFSNIRITVDKETVKIQNRNLFIDLEDYYFILKAERMGTCYLKKTLDVHAQPGETAEISIKDLLLDMEEEYTVTVTAHLRNKTEYAAAGHEVCFGQAVINEWKSQSESVTNEEYEAFKVIYGDVNIGVKGKDFTAMFSKQEGGIISLVYQGEEYITRTPKLTFWRATTDNDKGLNALHRDSGWLAASIGLRYIQESFGVEEAENKVKISMEYEAKYPECFKCRITYVMDASGTLEMEVNYPGISAEEEIPIFGIDFKMKREKDCFTYYGYGPEENYPDRKNGAKIGVYNSTAKENMSRYLIPQECGNREGVRYLDVKDEKGKGVRFEAADTPFACSVLPYSAYELENAMLMEDLPHVHYTWVRLLAKQTGVGGDDSWGAPIYPKYRIKANEPMTLKFKVKTLNK